VDWLANEMIALYILAGVVVAAAILALVLRNTVRTRLRMARQLRDDPDIHDFLVAFSWTPKVLYVPTILAALAAAVVMILTGGEKNLPACAKLVGGIWIAIFLVNFVIEEYEVNIKVLVMIVLAAGLLFLWLHLVGWVRPFLHLFTHLAVPISATGYILVAIIGAATILISWVRGLFYYVALTPNYMNIQEGVTETGEQINREDYNTRVDTGDFLERLLGFGKIVIIFKDQKRLPIVLLVWRIGRKTEMLDRIRGTIAIDATA